MLWWLGGSSSMHFWLLARRARLAGEEVRRTAGAPGPQVLQVPDSSGVHVVDELVVNPRATAVYADQARGSPPRSRAPHRNSRPAHLKFCPG